MSTSMPENSEDVVLEVRDLSVEFHGDSGWVRVVDNVSFSINRGETLGLVGESGSGKTVTSLAVMGLLDRAQSRVTGSVRLLGRELVGLSEAELAKIRGRDMSMVFQEARRSLDPAFTVGEQISEVIRRHKGLGRKEANARAVQLLTKVGINDAGRRAKAYPHQFSGGMCQRVMMAMALACDPALVIADEPTTALDVTVQKEVLDLMNDLQRELGLSILFITHDLGVVAETCDRVNVMYAGQIVESTHNDAIFLRPAHPYTAGLLAAIPDTVAPGGRLQAIPGAVPAPNDWAVSCRFGPRCAFFKSGTCDGSEVPMAVLPGGTESRCLRVHDITLNGVSE